MSARVFLSSQQDVVITLANASLEETKHALRSLSSLVCTLVPPISLTLDGLSLLKPAVLAAVERVLASCVVSSFTLSNTLLFAQESVSMLKGVLSNLLQQPDLRKVSLTSIRVGDGVAPFLVPLFTHVASLVEELAFNDVAFLTASVVKLCLAEGLKRLDLINCPSVSLEEALCGNHELESLGIQDMNLGGRVHLLKLPKNVLRLDLSNTGLSSVSDADAVADLVNVQYLTLADNPHFNIQLLCARLEAGECALRTLSLKGIPLSRADVVALTS
jgi:Leucine-rich repeat (LRR) protein